MILVAVLFCSVTMFAQVSAPKGMVVGSGGTAKTLSAAELGTLDGINTSSSIQSKLDAKVDAANGLLLSDSTYLKRQIDAKFESLFAGTYDRGAYRYRVQRDSTIIPNWSGLKTGMVAAWEFDETSGTTATNLVSGSPNLTANNGVLVNQTGKIGKAYKYDGVDDNSSCANNSKLQLTNYWTISMWIKLDATNTSMILSKDKYDLRITDAGSYLRYNGGTAIYYNFNTTDWFHVVVTNDNGAIKYYKNGSLVTSGTITSPTTNTEAFVLGSIYWQGSSFFNGLIDQTVVWNIALTADQVALVNQLGNQNKNTTLW